MKFTYKATPRAHPAFPKLAFESSPILHVRLNYKHSGPSPKIEAYVDSGAPDTYFHASVGRYIGIKIESGIEDSLGGILGPGGGKAPVFFHDVGLYFGADIIRIKAGFCEELAVAGILGRRGFFENFVVTFDHSSEPGSLEIHRINRT